MAVLTPREALEVCYEAGFRYGKGIVVMPAIGWAESRLKTDARGYNRDENGVVTSTDRGWLQINDKYHPGMSDAECDDPLAAAKYAFKISSGGTKFTLWSTYNSGAFRGPEGLTYKLFESEWNAKAMRLGMEAANREIVAQDERISKLIASLAATTDELKLTTGNLNTATEALKVTRVSLEAANGELATALAQKEEIARIAIERQVKIDNAQAALA